MQDKSEKFIIGLKRGMTQLFLDNGEAVPVTMVEAGPCQVVQVKTKANDGYSAVQLSFGQKRKLTKSLLGHLKGLLPGRYLTEFKITSEELAAKLQRGLEIKTDSFSEGDLVKVVGTSKGKGFQGVVRRHGFHGSPATHGHKDQLRMPGSIGAGGVQHVFKGTKMGGRMGHDQVTVANLQIVKIDSENNLLYLKGAVPGIRGGMIKIIGSGELKLHQPNTTQIADQPAAAATTDTKVAEEKPVVDSATITADTKVESTPTPEVNQPSDKPEVVTNTESIEK